MQRHGNNYIESPVARQSQCKQASQGLRQSLNTAVLKKMDELPQRVFVETEGVGRVKSKSSAAAQSATPFFVHPRRTAERPPALHTKISAGHRSSFPPPTPPNHPPRPPF